MICTGCGTTNPRDASFCMSCGNPLGATCRSCQNELPSEAAFCPSCGTAVGEEEQADEGLRRFVPPELLSKLEFASRTGGMQGERRTVTMLFCDIQGSTAAAENLDPEEWADIMNGAFERLIAPVYKYEGTLARLMGDAILAFFGAPISHEDDPERAVLASLEILDSFDGYKAKVKEAWGIEVEVRVGINTGLVVVGAVGSDLRVEYTAMGDAVNTAARMEQTAAPGTIQVAAETHRLVNHLFEFEDLGGVEVKGKSEPVASFRVIERKARRATDRGFEGLSSPLVGRKEELETLLDAVSATTVGNGSIVSILAEAGLGKSRLTEEVRARLDATVEWHEGRSLSFEAATPYAPVGRMLHSLLGLEPGLSAAEAWRRAAERVGEHLPGRVGDVTPHLLWILGIEPPQEYSHHIDYLDPPALRAEAFKAVLDLVSAIASTTPVVLVFEDLHWADPASLELIEDLLGLTEHSALMLILLFRPRREESSWRVHELAAREFPHRYTAVQLPPLGADETAELISNLLEIEHLPPQVSDLIEERAEGNPLFVEEILRSMIDQGMVRRESERWVADGSVTEIEIPRSVSAILTTRLDALEEGSRQVAQAASVVGRQFRYDEVAACLPDTSILEKGLVELQRRQLVTEVARVPKRLYRFRHGLVHEAAYSTLLLKQRTRHHAAIGEFIEQTQPERAEDLAHHFIRAQAPRRALPHLVAAGVRAAKSHATETAIDHLERAIGLMDESTPPELMQTALETLGSVKRFVFDLDGAAEAFTRLKEEGEARGNDTMLVSGLNKLGLLQAFLLDDRSEGLAHLARSEELARELELTDGLAEACMHQCYVRTASAEFEQVEHYMGELTRLGQELGAEEQTLFGLTHLANTFVYLTRFEEAQATADKGLALAEELENRHFQSQLLVFSVPWSRLAAGDLDGAGAAAEQGMEIARRINAREPEGLAALFQGKVAQEKGYLEDALALFRRASVAFEATGIPFLEAVGVCAQGTCHRLIGGEQFDTALDLHARTLEVMEMPTGSVMGSLLWTEIGQCILETGDSTGARAMFTRALEERTAPMFLARPLALLGLAEVARHDGDPAEARRHLEEAARYIEDRGMKHVEPEMGLTAGRILLSEGDYEGAASSLHELCVETESKGMRRVLLDALIELGRAHRGLQDDEASNDAIDRARRVAESMARDIDSEELRTAFERGLEHRLPT